MFRWTPEVIRFRTDAAEYGGFDANIASHILPYLPQGAHICDAGCGLGYLGLALAKAGHRVTCVDTSAEALSALRAHAAAEGIEGLSIEQGDLFSMPEAKHFDAMAFCFFGGTEETLRAVKRHCDGLAFLIKKNWATHRFKLHEKPLEKFTYLQTCERLTQLDVPYRTETFGMEMGQPFRSLDDAVAFYRTFDDEAGDEKSARSAVESLLVRTDSAEFPYYLPSNRPLGMIVLEAGRIPDCIYNDEGGIKK